MAGSLSLRASGQPTHLRRASRGPLILYLDASAFVKAFVDEPGSAEVVQAIRARPRLTAARHTFVETGRAVVRELGPDHPAGDRFGVLWKRVEVVDITQPLCEEALALAVGHGLRTLDALHLAAALRLGDESLVFATWDRDLWDAARAEGLTVLPEARP